MVNCYLVIFYSLLAFFFVHATAMPSMMSFADEAKKCPMMNMSLSVQENINNNTHECCTPDAAFVYFSIFQKEKHSVFLNIIYFINYYHDKFRSSEY